MFPQPGQVPPMNLAENPAAAGPVAAPLAGAGHANPMTIKPLAKHGAHFLKKGKKK